MKFKKLIMLSSLCIFPLMAACSSQTPMVQVEEETEETLNVAQFVDMELKNWDDIGLNIIYNIDNSDKVLDGDVEERYDRCKKVSDIAIEAVKAYFGQNNTLDGDNKDYMSDKTAKSEWDDRKFELVNMKALESLAQDEKYTGVYVAAMVNTPINSDLTTTEDSIKEVMFEIAFDGEKIEDFRLRDTNLDGTGTVEIFSPTDAYYGIQKSTGRIRKINRS